MPTVVDCSVHQSRFLAAFAESASVAKAARWARISRTAHYNWMALDPTYPPRFAEAQRRAVRSLEDEAVRRGREGVRRAVYHKGKIVGYETEYSDSLLLAVLRANDPGKFQPAITNADGTPAGTTIQLVLLPAGHNIPEGPQVLEVQVTAPVRIDRAEETG
jgi:hypothetical protein